MGRSVALAIVLATAGCGPKVSTAPSFDEDLGPKKTTPTRDVAEAPRPLAPPGKGLRTGTIARARLVAILDAGPAAFLRQLEVAPHLRDGNRFVGWQLVQLVDQQSPLYDVDVVPGDILLAINGKPLARPDQLQTLWDSLRSANAVSAQLWRGDAQLTLEFAVEPKL